MWKIINATIIPIVLYLLLVLSLLLSSVLTGSGLTKYLYVILLFVPWLDCRWSVPVLKIRLKSEAVFLLIVWGLILCLLISYPFTVNYFLTVLFFTALPEEWFFRGYLLRRAGSGLKANVLVSVAFSVLHGFNQSSLLASLTFFPSIVLGSVYQKTESIYLSISLHALFNLVFMIYIKQLFARYTYLIHNTF